jgi:rhomboid protease GluP
VVFVLLLVVIYGITSYPNHFQAPTDLAVMLGGFYPPLVQQGEWWRYITATLMHGNLGHLFNNAAGLLIFGNLLEPVIGGTRLIGLYIVSALAGLSLSYYLMPKGLTFGASTIDYGLIGTYLTLILLVRYRSDRQAFFREFRGALLFVILFVGWNTLESTTVNLWGHVGGLIAGVLYAVFIWQTRPKRSLSAR